MSWASPVDGEEIVKGNRKFRYSSANNSWDIVDEEGTISISSTWRTFENGDDLEFQKYIVDTWVTKSQLGGGVAPTQPPEVGDEPVVIAPEIVALDFYDPSVAQDVDGCIVDDEDAITVTMEVIVTNGILDMPFSTVPEEIGGGVRFNNVTVVACMVELDGMTFEPVNLVGPPVGPQDGTITINFWDDAVPATVATKVITVTVLNQGR